MRFTLSFAATALLLLTGASSLEAQDAKPKRDRNVISSDEIQASSATNAHELVRSLRPQWLRTRGQSTLQTQTTMSSTGEASSAMMASQIMVYVNGVKFGSVETLSNVATADVDKLQFMDATTATQRYGTNHTHGAILIDLRRR